MAVTFCLDTTGEDSYMIWAYTDTVDGARAVCCDLQSLGGALLESDGAFVYCVFGPGGIDDALLELEEAGYDYEEV